VYAENDKNEQMLKKQRQRQGDKIEEYRGEHDGKNYEDQSTKNTSRYQQNELIIKILWAPFDKTFKLLPQMNASLGDSRFHLSFGNLNNRTNRRLELGNTDQADMLHLSETVMMNDLMGNLPKRKTENLEPVEAQTSKRSNRKFKRGYKRISSKMLHIQFSIEEDKNMVKIIVH
jgi:hypothetical protein